MKHPHGRFTWADLSVPDVAQGSAFYGGLFGWESEDRFDPDGNHIYTMFSKDGQTVAGMGPLSDEMIQMGARPAWNNYINVENVDAVIESVTANGGSVMVPAMDVMDTGRMAFVTDAQGAAVGLWQPGTHEGADQFNQPGFMSWNELNTRDAISAQEFWGNVMGWTFETTEQPTGPYTTIMLGDRQNGGIIQMNERWPADAPSYWMIYFSVEDTDATLAKTKDLGGQVLMPAMDIPAGRMGMIADDQGAMSMIIQIPPDQID